MISISVIMCAFNAENTVAEAIESVLNQTISDFEFIFINDGSVDGTLGIVKSYANKDARITVVDQQNCGVGLSRNRAISICKGEYIAFLDADDIWLEQKLEWQIRILKEDPKTDIVIAESMPYQQLKECAPEMIFKYERCYDFFERIVGNNLFFQPQTALMKRSLFEIANFTDDYSGQDYYLFLIYAVCNKIVYQIKCPLYGERSLSGSLQRSPKSGFSSGMARHKAIKKVLIGSQYNKYLNNQRVNLLKIASDRFLGWAAAGSRNYMKYIASVQFVSNQFYFFYKKKYYFMELAKTIFFPILKKFK